MCVLVNGTPQEELANGVVKLPFGTEYVLRFRNKNNRRAVVKISLDGENISENGFIVPPNDFIDIKRPANKDAAFKFVSLDSPDAIDHGKNGPNHEKIKGTIEAKFYLEKEQQVSLQAIYRNTYPTWTKNNDVYKKHLYEQPHAYQPSVFGVARCIAGANAKYQALNIDPQVSCPSESSPLKDGCTVEGNMTGQYFSTSCIDCEETYTTLKIFLQGFDKKPKGKYRALSGSKHVTSIEEENEQLRAKIAELENKKLKQELAALTKKSSKKNIKNSLKPSNE